MNYSSPRRKLLTTSFVNYHPDWILNLKSLVNETLHFGSKINFVEILIIGWIAVIQIERIRVAQHVRLDETRHECWSSRLQYYADIYGSQHIYFGT
jgi:hypothetical protein